MNNIEINIYNNEGLKEQNYKEDEHQTRTTKKENSVKSSLKEAAIASPTTSVDSDTSKEVISRVFLGEIGEHESELKKVGLSHADCIPNIEKSFALLQDSNGEVTVLNKAEGSGYVSLSVGCKPKLIVDPNGNVAIGSIAPKSKLHVDGMISVDDFYLIEGVENLSIIRGGFSLKSLEPKIVTGYSVSVLEDGGFEVKFDEPFSKRPLVIAVLHLPQTAPSLIRVDYVDCTKFIFHDASEKYEVRLFF